MRKLRSFIDEKYTEKFSIKHYVVRIEHQQWGKFFENFITLRSTIINNIINIPHSFIIPFSLCGYIIYFNKNPIEHYIDLAYNQLSIRYKINEKTK